MRTLFGAERRFSLENPSIPLTDVGLLDFFGWNGSPTDSGVSVSEETSLRMSTVYRCVTLRAGIVAALPLKAYRYKDKSTVYVKVLSEPDQGLTPFERMEMIMNHLLLWGNAYVAKVRDPLGRIIELRPIHPYRVTPEWWVDPTKKPTDPDYTVKRFQVTNDAGIKAPYTTYDIMHIMGPTLDGLAGLSVIGLARNGIGVALAAEKLAAKLFANGNLLSGVLSSERVLTQPQADALKKRWREKMQGVAHAHDVAVLDNGTKFTPIAMPPEDAQFLQTRAWQVADISRWFGIPLHLIGETTKSTSWGKGLEEQNIGLIRYTVQSDLSRIEQRFTREVTESATQYCEFLVDGLLRATTLERYQAYQIAVVNTGFMTRNEARVKENLKPIPGLDEPLLPPQALPDTSTTPVPVDEESDVDTDVNDEGDDEEGDDEAAQDVANGTKKRRRGLWPTRQGEGK